MVQKPLVISLAIAACARNGAKSASDSPERDWSSSATDTVLATVDGVPIRRSEVEQQAKLTHTDAKAALSELIQFELLAREAKARGFGNDRQIDEEIRRVSVQQLLAHTFEKDFTKKNIPKEALEEEYEKNNYLYVHTELRDCAHFLVQPKPDAKPEEREQTIQRARTLYAEAKKTENHLENFLALKNTPAAEGAKLEDLPRMPAEALDKGFADELFRLRIGQVSQPVQSSYGWHIIYLEKIEPPRNLSFEAAKGEIIDKLWATERAKGFARFVDGLVKKYPIVRNEAALEATP